MQFADRLSHTLWIGVRASGGSGANRVWRGSNGRPMEAVQMDWAPGEPRVSGTCAVADKSLG